MKKYFIKPARFKIKIKKIKNVKKIDLSKSKRNYFLTVNLKETEEDL